MAKNIRNWTYGVRRPVEGLERVLEQIDRAKVYRNDLIALERTRRERWRGAVLLVNPALPELEAELEAARQAAEDFVDAAAARNAVERRRLKLDRDEKAALAALKAERSRLTGAARAERLATPELPRINAENKKWAQAEQRRLRAGCGLYWGTYQMIEEARQGDPKGAPPEFRRRTLAEKLEAPGEGSVAVHIQGEIMTWADALACRHGHMRVQMLAGPYADPTSPRAACRQAADPTSQRSAKRLHALLWLRVGSEGRAPLWAKVPILLHRQPPPETRIKWVKLFRSLMARRDEWRAVFTFAAPDEGESWRRDDLATEGTLAVNVGWRQVPEGLRAAVGIGSDDQRHVLYYPRAWIEEWDFADSLRAIRDRNFNGQRAALAAWLKEREADLPDWLREDARHLAQWKTPLRLEQLVERWREARWPGDEAMLEHLVAWRKQHRHVHDREANVRANLETRRDDLFRRWAGKLRHRYETVVLGDVDYRALKGRKRPTDDEDELCRIARRNGHRLAPGRLSEVLRDSFARAVKIKAVNVTARCHACGTVNVWDQGRFLRRSCQNPQCPAEWDQDDNAAINLLLLEAEMRAAAC